MFKKRRFKGRSKPVGKYRSQLEARFAEELDSRKRSKKIVWWRYEPCSFRLIDQDRSLKYIPDFMVMLPTGAAIFYEVKGFWKTSGRNKTKLFADQYWMFEVVGAMFKKKQWVYEGFSS